MASPASDSPSTATAGHDFAQYLNVRKAFGSTFSPDGKTLAFLTDITGVAEVWSVPVDVHAERPAWPDQLTFLNERILGASYSPTENVLVLGGDWGGNERTQLALVHADGSGFKPLTTQPDVIHVFGGWQEDGTSASGWAPDGKSIVYASNARDARYFDVYVRALDGEPRVVYSSDATNYPVGFSPDGRSVLVERVVTNVRNQLLLVDVASGQARPLTPAVDENNPGHGNYMGAQWSADGRGLYLVSDVGRNFHALAYLDVASGELRYLTDENWDVEGLALSRDAKRLAVVTNVDGYSRLDLFDITQGWEQRQKLPTPELRPGVVGQVKWAPNGEQIACTLMPPDDTMDVWLWDLGERILWRATRSATGGIPREDFVAPRLVRFPTFDGRQIPAFLYLPRGGEPRGLPVIINVHGGPEGQARPAFMDTLQYYVGQGYGVLATNVRGSTGYGYEYQSLDDVRQRMDSVADLKAAVEWLASSSIADPKRIAVMGGSYGGFMTLAAITTYPDLWAAAVDTVGIANFVTFLERTGPWRRKLREPEYGSLEHDRDFLESISPINHVEQIVAPLFVIHGANDPRVPIGEAEQIVAALEARNVPVEYKRFEDEGHGIQKRKNRLALYPEVAAFLAKYLKGE